jgi:hypothetical protein
VRADNRGEGEGGGRREGKEVRPHGRWDASARTHPSVRGVNVDAGGRPNDVRGCLDEKDVRTVIFIQKRPL